MRIVKRDRRATFPQIAADFNTVSPTSDRSICILSDNLHSFMSIVYSDGLAEFQQDNVTTHTSINANIGSMSSLPEFGHFPASQNHQT
ncbi:hypothetical protein TNCV_4869041 [Trichonephila clavipes]|nr:hypothetical protein TNCV_4869041 [Trichonephila clavipes]